MNPVFAVVDSSILTMDWIMVFSPKLWDFRLSPIFFVFQDLAFWKISLSQPIPQNGTVPLFLLKMRHYPASNTELHHKKYRFYPIPSGIAYPYTETSLIFPSRNSNPFRPHGSFRLPE